MRLYITILSNRYLANLQPIPSLYLIYHVLCFNYRFYRRGKLHLTWLCSIPSLCSIALVLYPCLSCLLIYLVYIPFWVSWLHLMWIYTVLVPSVIVLWYFLAFLSFIFTYFVFLSVYTSLSIKWNDMRPLCKLEV